MVQSVQKTYGGVSSLQADFLQESFLSALDVSEQSSGKMQFRKPGQMRWDYLKPEAQLFLIRDKVLTLFQPKENQVIRQRVEDVFLTDLPASFIMGIGDLSRDFKLVAACDNADGVVLELSPARAASADKGDRAIKTFKLLINPSSYLPVGARVVDVGGNSTAILFQTPKTNALIPDSTFEFTAPKGADIIERTAGE